MLPGIALGRRPVVFCYGTNGVTNGRLFCLGCRPLPVQAARAALNNGPFKAECVVDAFVRTLNKRNTAHNVQVSKAVDLGRALVFHGEIEDTCMPGKCERHRKNSGPCEHFGSP